MDWDGERSERPVERPGPAAKGVVSGRTRRDRGGRLSDLPARKGEGGVFLQGKASETAGVALYEAARIEQGGVRMAEDQKPHDRLLEPVA